MTPLPNSILGTDVKVIILLQLFNKSKLRNGINTFLEPNGVYYPFNKREAQCSLLNCATLAAVLFTTLIAIANICS